MGKELISIWIEKAWVAIQSNLWEYSLVRFNGINKLFMWIVFATCWTSIPYSLKACLGCNIHNNLAEAVCCSSNIVIGKLIERPDQNSVKIEVVRKIHGTIRAGQVVHMKAWSRPEDVGKQFVFSERDTRTFGDYIYEMLPADFEEEVAFVLKLRSLQTKLKPRTGPETALEGHLSPEVLQKYVIKDAKEAIRLVQGFSNESKEIGIEYLRKLRPFPTPQIIETIETIRKEAFGDKEVFAADNRLANLVEALMLVEDQEAQQYLLQKVEDFLKQEPAPINWEHAKLGSTLRGEFLTAVLGVANTNWNPWVWAYVVPNRKQFPALEAKQSQTIMHAFPLLREEMLADMTAALYDAKLATPEQLLAKLNGPTNQNAFALGVARIAGPKAHPFWGKEGELALSHLRLILPLITQSELKRSVEERIRWNEEMKAKATSP